ncbi:MAG: low temperature requirement protein A [Chloroflexota bacterium]
MTDLFTPPRFFKNVPFTRHTDRSIGWLELFYDLVYVATFIQIGNFLSDNLTLLGFGQFLVLVTIVWWAWTGETFYQNRYFVDDLIHRALVFVQIFAIASIGLSVSKAFGELYVQFTLAYVITRLMLVLMYLRSSKVHPESRAFSRGYVYGFSIGIAIWLGSLLLPAEIHWVGWLVGITFELCVPLMPKMRALARNWPVDIPHITERFGIFTIIVLGESFVKILDDSQGTAIGAPQFIFSIFGFIVLFSLWWLYFSDTAEKLVNFSSYRTSFPWVYGHLPLATSLIAFGVAAKKLYASTLKYPADPATPEYRLLYTAAIVLFLLALAAIDYGLDADEAREELIHVVGAVLTAIFGLVAVGASPAMYVGVVAVIMATQVGYSIYRERNEEPDSAHH